MSKMRLATHVAICSQDSGDIVLLYFLDDANSKLLSYKITTLLKSQFFPCDSELRIGNDRLLHNYTYGNSALCNERGANWPHALSTIQLTKNYLTCQNVISSHVLGPRAILSWQRGDSTRDAHNKRKNFVIQKRFCLFYNFNCFDHVYPKASH